MSVEDIKRSHDIEEVRRLNSDALSAVMISYGIVLPRHGHGWRACARERGEIRGIVGNLTILCTDGIVGYFLWDTGAERPSLFYGHVKDFSGDVRPAHSLPKPSATAKPGCDASRPKKVKPSTVSMALEMLAKLTQNAPK